MVNIQIKTEIENYICLIRYRDIPLSSFENYDLDQFFCSHSYQGQSPQVVISPGLVSLSERRPFKRCFISRSQHILVSTFEIEIEISHSRKIDIENEISTSCKQRLDMFSNVGVVKGPVLFSHR